MDNLAFLFGRMSERYEAKMQRICAYLSITPHSTFTVDAIKSVFDRLVELSETPPSAP